MSQTTTPTVLPQAAEGQGTTVFVSGALPGLIARNPGATIAEIQAAMATEVAAGKPPEPMVITIPPPVIDPFPMVLYNAEKRLVKLAKDKEEKETLAKEGFTEDPFPAEDPDAITPAEIMLLKSVIDKLAKAVNKLDAGEPPSVQKPAEKPPTTTTKK